MTIAAICRIALVLALLTACGSQRGAERDAVRSNAVNCLVRETHAIAPQPVDLDTATFAVLARCDYPGVLERSIAANYPVGYRDYIRAAIQKEYAGIVDSTRRGIAMTRANAAASSNLTKETQPSPGNAKAPLDLRQ